MKDELVMTVINSRGLKAIQILPIIETTHYLKECETCHTEGWHDTYMDGSIHHPTGIITPALMEMERV